MGSNSAKLVHIMVFPDLLRPNFSPLKRVPENVKARHFFSCLFRLSKSCHLLGSGLKALSDGGTPRLGGQGIVQTIRRLLWCYHKDFLISVNSEITTLVGWSTLNIDLGVRCRGYKLIYAVMDKLKIQISDRMAD